MTVQLLLRRGVLAAGAHVLALGHPLQCQRRPHDAFALVPACQAGHVRVLDAELVKLAAGGGGADVAQRLAERTLRPDDIGCGAHDDRLTPQPWRPASSRPQAPTEKSSRALNGNLGLTVGLTMFSGGGQRPSNRSVRF